MADSLSIQPARSGHKATEFFASLEGMRGIAALGVALYHVYWFWHLRDLPLIRHGALLVDFFFVISGFVISHIYAARLRSWSNLCEYFVLRTARLYPLHLFTLLVIFALMLLMPWIGHHWRHLAMLVRDHRLHGGTRNLLLNLALVQSLARGHPVSFNRPSWSISTEYYTYFFFALIAFIASGKRMFILVVSAIVATTAGYQLWRDGGLTVIAHHDKSLLSSDLYRCLLDFFLGVMLQFVWQVINTRMRHLLGRPWRSHLAETLCAAFACVALWESSRGRMQFVTLSAFCLVVLAFSLSRGWLTRVLEGKVCQRLGKWSYSIYMTHFIVLVLFGDILRVVLHARDIRHAMEPWGFDVVTALFVGTVLLISSLTYRYIEVPPRAWARNWAERRRDARELNQEETRLHPW